MPRLLRPLACAFAFACLLPATAVLAAPKKPNDRAIVNSTAFLSAHPDLNWRLRGLDAYRQGDFEEALKLFRKAARFADKPAQGMVAEMLWQGQGTAQDKALAYAWMDLAAERNYPTMVLNRERYWKALDDAQRQDALARGRAVFAEYADAVAKPRLEAQLRRGRVSSGSHVAGGGAGRAVSITIAGPGGSRTIDASEYYAEQYWAPEQYWAWQDDDWRTLPRGVVNIGPLEAPAAPATDASPGADADPAQ